jgi:RNA-binding protein 8A
MSMKVKGRGGRGDREEDDRYAGRGGVFESLDDDDMGGADGGPARSVEGWVIMVGGVHEEAQEEDLFDAFSDMGEIKNLHLNLDRRTGFVKGYCFIEYGTKREAGDAIQKMHGGEVLGSQVGVDWAFSKPADSKRRAGARKR